ncbi:MAG: hypothetical protein KJ690_08470 [Alphaproteobacteria bacterium]|nr:hypothetical protein [Alphaproteobacteria bacterium]
MALNPTLPKALMPIRPEQAHHRQQARRAREALLAWINDSGCNWCLTLNPNRELPLGTEVGIVRAAFDDTDRDLLGPRYRFKDARRRQLGFVFAEHLRSNLHFHIALRPGDTDSLEDQRRRAEHLARSWATRVPGGTTEVAEATCEEGWSRYITKEIYRPDFEFWSSSMWWPERQRRHVLDSSWADPHSGGELLQ